MTWKEGVEWADGWILRLDELPEELPELSLSARRPNEAFTLLRKLAQVGESGAALSMLVQKLRDEIDAERVDAVVLAGRLADVAALSFDEQPEDVRLPAPPPEFRDAAWLLTSISVERGSYGGEEEFDRNLSEEVLNTLRRFL